MLPYIYQTIDGIQSSQLGIWTSHLSTGMGREREEGRREEEEERKRVNTMKSRFYKSLCDILIIGLE